MRKTIFTLIVLLTSSMMMFAQLENFVLDDFENGNVNFTEEVNVNPPGSFEPVVVDNPVKNAVNGSEKVWKWSRIDTGDNQSWAGFWASLIEEVPAGYTSIEIKYLRTNETSQMRIKCEGSITKEFNSVEPATKVNEWEVLKFDLVENGILNVRVLAIFPDYCEPLNVDAVNYIDDITFVYESGVVTPTEYVLFDDSNNNRFHDQSWSPGATAPSTLTLAHWQDPDLDGDKFPVVTEPVKSGENALMLRWKSAADGDWSILLAGIDWPAFNLTDVKYLRFFVNSPVGIAKEALPNLHLESHSAPEGTPNTTGIIAMGDYVNDISANQWTEVRIPLADFWAANTEFEAKNLVKGVFFSQTEADAVDHTLYMDLFTFDSDETGIQKLVAQDALRLYYTSGMLTIKDYSGSVQVMDVIGKTLIRTQMKENLSFDLKNGIYIVATDKGNAKLMVR